MSMRDIKRKARQQVHRTMRLPCWRVSHDGVLTAVHARLHIARTNMTNDYAGDLLSMGFAERANQAPKLVFFRPEVEPMHGDTYLFKVDEAYGVEAVLQPDDEYISADCYTCSESQIATALGSLSDEDKAKVVFPVTYEV